MNPNPNIPTPEALVASVSPRQAQNRVAESVLRARVSVDSVGSLRKLTRAVVFITIALLLGAGAVFAPPGAGASILAMFATAALIIGGYYVLEFDPGVLKQAMFLLEQNLGSSFLRAAETEARKLASDQIAGVLDRMHQEVSDMMANQGTSLAGLKGYYDDASATMRAVQDGLLRRLAGARQADEGADKELRKASAAFEERIRRGWLVRLIPAASRVPARQWIAAVEKSLSCKLEQIAAARATEVCDELSRLISMGVQEYAQAVGAVSGAAVEADTRIQGVRALQNLTGSNKQFPLTGEIEALVAAKVVAGESVIRHGIASRPPDQSVAEAVGVQAATIVAALPLPEFWEEFYGQRNGDRGSVLRQIDQQSLEFCNAETKPGSTQIRFRFLLAQGGGTSPTCKDVEKANGSISTRSIDHPQANEVVCVTESRFEPASIITEYLEAARQFQSLPADKRAQMIVEVEDDETLLCYAPESSHDAGRPSRLLCLGLLMGLVKRTGAESYKLSDRNDAGNAPFAKGFDQAVDVLSTDLALARQIEQGLGQVYSVEGVEAIRAKIAEAKTKSLVPKDAGKRFRDTLDEELRRLNATQGQPGA